MKRIKKHVKKHVGWHYLDDPKHLFFVVAIILGGLFGVRYSIQAYPEVFKTEIKNLKNHVDLTEPMVIEFSEPMSASSYVSDIQINPEVKFTLSWEEHGRKLVIDPEKYWKPETEYTLIIPEGRNLMFTRVAPTRLKFTTPSYPRITSFFPGDGAKDVTLDIEDPMVVNFDKSTHDFFVKFEFDPKVPVTYENNAEKTQFKILPKEKLQEGVAYKINVRMKYKEEEDEAFQELAVSSFSTLPPAPKDWDKDFNARIEQARRYTTARIESGKYIDINLAAQILSIFENGKILDAYLISTGKRGMDTPKGEFKIMAKRSRPWSRKYALYMPWFMQFTGEGHGIHELPEWPGGYKEGANHLGIPVSHGCVRLGIGPAKRVYEWTDAGTPIVIH